MNMQSLILTITILLMMAASGCNNPSGGSVIGRGNAPFLQKPAAFSFSQIRAANGVIDISWRESKRVANYSFVMGTDQTNITTPVPGCSGVEERCQITGLDPDTVYYFDITATNDAGSQKISSIGSALSVKTFDITSSTPSDGVIDLTWGTSGNATAYNVTYGRSSGSYTTTVQNVTSPYTITGLTNGVRYYVRVVAVNTQNGYLLSTTEVNHQPYGPLPAPTGLTLTASPGQMFLDWNDSSGATEYKIFRGTSAGSLSLIPGGPYTSSDFTDTGLTNGQTYFYAIKAYNGFDSVISATESAQPIASFAMTSATASPGPGQVTVTWSTPVLGATGYDIIYGTNPASLTSRVSNATSPYLFNSLTPNLPYYFRVVAKNGVGSGTTFTSTNQLSATPLIPLAVPTALTATATPGQVVLNWNDVPGATSYKIYKSTSTGSLTLVGGGPYTTSDFTDSAVTNGQVYFYAVRATNGTFDSNQTAEVSIKPVAPLSLTAATVATFSSANITWTNTAGADIYDIRYGTSPGTYTQTATNRTSTATITGLVGATTYYVAVIGRNTQGTGTSVLSNELSFTTTATFPTVTIDNYPLINNANKAAYTVSGTCTENTRVVTVTIGTVSSAPTCTGSAWSATMNVTSVADSAALTITAVHTNSGGNNNTKTRTVIKDTNVPTVAITTYPTINNANKAAYTVAGTCSENTRTVTVSIGGIPATPTCTSLAWTTTVDASGLTDGAGISITADLSDASGNTAVQATRSISKDTSVPSVAITSSPSVNNANKAAYTFSGTCSETGQSVAVKVGSTTSSVTCTLLTWSATLNVTANADSAVLLVTADHSDTAGNAATQASTLVVKDTVNPTVTIASASLINNANKDAYTVSGTCSENTRNVAVSVGGVNDTQVCTGSTWSSTLDVSAVTDSGSVSITATHTDVVLNSTTASTSVVKNTNLPTVAISTSPIIFNANKAAYPISGTCSENGRPVSVNVGGVTASPSCSAGAWTASLNVTAIADNAAVSITVNHGDAVGNNANPATTTVLKDTVAPTVAITSSPTINNGNKAAYPVSGTCSEDTRNVTVTIGAASATATCTSSAWNASLNVTAVADGASVTVSAAHTDAAGNSATPSTASVVKDTTNPTVAITTYPTINNVNKAAYTVSGTCSENTRQVSVSVGGVTASPVCTTLTWSATLNVSGVTDNNSIPVTADHADAAGNSATQATRTVVKDTTAPTVAITTSAVINNSNKTAYPVSGTCSETGQNVSVSVGSTTATVSCTLLTWSASMNVSANGDTSSLNVTADHSDSAGNPAVQAVIMVVKDTVNPTVAITSAPVINNANKASYTVSGTCSENTRTVSVSVGGVSGTPTCTTNTWTSTLNVTSVPDGSSVSVTANHNDSAANNATQASTTVIKNTALPTVAITSSPVINNTNKAAYTVSGTCTESTRIVTVNVGGVSATPTCSGTTWTTTVNVTAVADSGTVSITADHSDSDGNVANQASTTVVKDTVIPLVAITSSPTINNSNKAAYPVSGTCSENTRTVSVSVGAVSSTPICTAGAWSASLNVTALADNASVAVTANHTDAAGNAAIQASASVAKDTSNPTVAITAPSIINNTNKASYTVSGSCSENTRTVSVSVGGVAGTPTCTASAWTVTLDLSGISDSGSVAVTADHSDVAGNNATQATASAIKDTAIPTIAISVSPIINNTNKAAYTISGSCSENTRTVSVNVGGVTSTPVCSANAWSSTLNVTAVADSASVSISADQTDAAGNAATQATTNVLKNTVIPTVAITTPTPINNSNNAAYPISGACSENGRTVSVNVGGVTATPSCSGNAWSATMNVSGVPDNSSVAVSANHSDAAGNAATQASTTVVKSTGLPTVAVTSTTAINNTNKAAYLVSGTCSENLRTVSVNVGGVSASPTCTTGTWSTSVNVTGVADGGAVAITADHSDAVGNAAIQATASVLKDTVIPTVTITSSPVIYNANKTTYTVSGACSENSRTVTVVVGSVSSTPTCTTLAWTTTVNVSALSDSASVSITANHTDLAGNAATQASTTVVKDTSNPTVAITSSPVINNANKTSYTVSGTCSENTRIVSVSVGGVTSSPACSTGAWSATVNASGLSDGSVSITADHSDLSGNTSTQATATAQKDTSNPTVAISSSTAINNTNKTAYTVNGTCSENTRTVSVNVGGVGATPTCSSLTWSTTVNVSAVGDNASLSITADHSDVNSNNAAQATASVLKDTVIPTVTITSAPAINNTNKAAYPVSGACSENTRTVTVSVGGVSATPTCTGLAWTASVNVSGIADSASVAVTANHSDLAGNTATTASTTVSKDTTDPTVAITSSTAINNTNKASYPVSGTCSENSRPVTVNVGGVTATPTCTALAWSTSLNVTGVADDLGISMTADHADVAGNPAVQASTTVLKDTLIPTVTITSNTIINNSNKASYTVTGSCSENTRTVSVNVGSASGTATCTALVWSASLNVTAVADNASVAITANHTDLAGNSATQASMTVLKDTSSPTVAISSAPMINNTNKASYIVSGSCSENTRTVSVSVGGLTSSPFCSALAWSATLDVTSLGDSGSISVTANHSDAAGNAATQASTTVSKDTTPPTVAVTSSTAINNTNKASYAVSGTCSENTRTVTVNVGGVAATPTCSASAWSTTMNVSAVGDNASVAITADHSDLAGNSATQATASVLKDTVIPTVTITSSPVINNANKGAYTVSGACSENTRTVTVSVGGVTSSPICTTLVWSATLNVTAVPDGASVSITANHTDLAGNAATQASTTVVKDANIPTVAITSSPVINNANKAAYTVSGTCSENTRTVSVNIGGVAATPTCSAGSWSTGAINVTTVSDSGTVAITADHTDINSNNAVQATASVLKDTANPTVAITSAPNINNTNKTAYTASGTCSENGRPVAVSIGGVATSPTCSGLAWTTGAINVSAAADSATLLITANHADVAGNSATQASTTVVKDSSNPTVAITSTPVINNSNKSTYTVSGTCSETGQTVTVNVGSVNTTYSCTLLTWSVTVDVSGNPDSLTLLITADHTDAAGNTAVQSGTTVVKDTVNPTVAISSAPAINNANKTSYTASGTCSENTRAVTVNIGGVSATPACSGGTWTTGSINVSAAADSATLSVTANHTDSALNNATQASTTIVKDTSNPTVAITSSPTINLANMTAYTVSGTCSEDTRTVAVSVGGVAATPTCSSGSWTTGAINVSTASDSATFSITANHTDASANVATQATASIVKDTAAPGVTLSSSEPATTSASPFIVRATFTEAVTGVTLGDFVVGNGTASALSPVSGTIYDLSVTPSADGLVTVNMAASVAQDAVGNNNTIAAQLSRTYVAPGVLSFAVTTTHDFGNIPVGGSADLTILVNKTGPNVTSVSEIGLAAPFTLKGGAYPGTGGTCGTTISGSCSIVVTYSPTAAAVHNDTIELRYNNGAGLVSVTRNLTGTGVTVSPTLITIDGPSGVPTSQCIPYTINAQTSAGINANVTANQTVNLVVNNGTGTFYSNNTCGTVATSTIITANTSSKVVYFRSTTAAQILTLVFNPTSLTSATKDVTTASNATRIAFTTPAEMETNICTPIIVDLVDATGTKAGKSTAVTVNLGKTGAAVFYSDVNCTGVITTVAYPAFTDTKTVYIKDPTAQSVTITLTDAAAILTQDSASISFVNALSWWNTAYMKRLPITIDNEDQATAHTNMPVLVRLDSSKIDYSDILSGGADIRFTLADHTTTLSYDIESWNASGESFVWVKIPTVAASADMVIYMYYNNSSASDNQSPANTWSAFTGVWNMDKTGANYYDATNLGKNAAPEGTVADVTGPAGNAIYVNGSSTINTGTNLATLLGVSTTMSFWIKTTQVGTNQFYTSPAITGVREDSSFNEIYFGYLTNTGTVGITSKNGQKAESTFTVNDGTWRHVTMNRNSANGAVRFYINGVFNDNATSGSGTITTNFSRFGALSFPAGAPVYLNGSMDSIRIQSGVQTDARIRAEYKFSMESHVSYGSAQNL